LYMGVKFLRSLWGFFTQFMKFCTWIWSFVPGYEDLHLGMKFCTWVWRFEPGHEV
jgi:hypothetical protein